MAYETLRIRNFGMIASNPAYVAVCEAWVEREPDLKLLPVTGQAVINGNVPDLTIFMAGTATVTVIGVRPSVLVGRNVPALAVQL